MKFYFRNYSACALNHKNKTHEKINLMVFMPVIWEGGVSVCQGFGVSMVAVLSVIFL
jgi:hypothetical protein